MIPKIEMEFHEGDANNSKRPKLNIKDLLTCSPLMQKFIPLEFLTVSKSEAGTPKSNPGTCLVKPKNKLIY